MASSAAKTSNNIEDDDDNDWIPLQTYGDKDGNLSQHSTMASSKAPVNKSTTNSTNKREFYMNDENDSNPKNPKDHHDASRNDARRGDNSTSVALERRESLSSIRTKLESRVKVREDLVNHPLHHFWGRFLVHLASETWNQDATFRTGLVLVAVGAAVKFLWIISISTQFWFHPRTIFLVVVLCLSLVYLLPTINVEKQMEKFVLWITSPTAMIETLSNLLERIPLQFIFLCLLLTPTLLEARLLAFLTTVVAEAGWTQNIACSILILGWIYSQFSSARIPPRDCTLQGLVILYAAALVISISRLDLGRIRLLAGPFCLATGTMLLVRSNEDEFRCSRIIRHSLRLTLRDVLASVGEKVKEDEMLQIAMLRWIVDYWASSTQGSSPSKASQNSSTPSSSTHTHQNSSNTASQAPSQMQVHQQHELEWGELCSMLTMTTDQMGGEVQTDTSETSQPTPSSSSNGTKQQQSSAPNMTSPSQESNESLNNLTSMLASMDVDERARPAVLAYKRTIEDFPPSRWIAEYVAVLRRCPAVLTLACFYILGSPMAISTTITLAPFVIFEVLRVKRWARACRIAFGVMDGEQQERNEQVKPDNITPLTTILSLPGEMESMTIILSDDVYLSFQPTTLLLVWENIRASVVALEAGLTAARCVQTTAVAANFAGDVMSLAHFGVQVSRGGLLHGVGIVIGELIQMHAASNDPSAATTRNNGDSTRYTSAAINATKNGQILAREVGILMEGGGQSNPIIDPVVGVLSAVVGRGWLWGKEEESKSSSKDTTDKDDLKSPLESLANTEASMNEEGGQNKESETATEDKESKVEVQKEKGENDRSVDETPINDDELPESITDTASDLDEANREKSLDSQEKLAVQNAEADNDLCASEDNLPHTLTGTQLPPKVSEKAERAFQSGASSEARDLPNNGQTATSFSEDQEDIADLMERLFDAYERKLIMEDEKNALMESLASGDTSAIDIVRKSLDCVLYEDFLPTNDHDVEPCSTGNTHQPSENNFVTNEHPNDDQHFDPIVPDASERRVIESDSENVNESETRKCNSHIESNEKSEQASNVVRETVLVEEVSGTPNQESSDEKSGDGNWLHLVGGGLAVVGAAVVGGIALAQKGGANSDENNDNRRTGYERKTPYIEEIVDEEKENPDDWESVSASNTRVK